MNFLKRLFGKKEKLPSVRPICNKIETTTKGNKLLEETLRVISIANSPADTSSAKITHSKIEATPKKIFTAKDLETIREYVVLDVETTGFSRSNDRIIEIAVIQ